MAPDGAGGAARPKRAQHGSLLSAIRAGVPARVLTAMALLGLLVVLGALGAIGGSVSARETNLAHTASVRTEVAMMEEDAAPHAMPMMAMAAPAMDMAFKRSMPMADMPAGSSRGMPGGGGANIIMGSAATSGGGGGGNSGLDEVVADMAASA